MSEAIGEKIEKIKSGGYIKNRAMAESSTVYIGSGKQGKYTLDVSVCLDKIPDECFKDCKGKRYVNLHIGERRSGLDEWGNTHWVSVRKPITPETIQQIKPGC